MVEIQPLVVPLEVTEAMDIVKDWWRGEATPVQVAEALAKLPSVSEYPGSFHMALSMIREGQVPGARVMPTDGIDWDGRYPRFRVLLETP